MKIDEMPAGREMDALIARVVYGLDTEVFSDALGEALYIVDRHATRNGPNSTSATVFGCSWVRARNRAGEIVDFFGRLCPMWSDGVIVWELVDYLLARLDILVEGTTATATKEPVWFCRLADVNGHQWHAYASTRALAVCRAVLKASKPRLEAVGLSVGL